jgi:hypothetical protein
VPPLSLKAFAVGIALVLMSGVDGQGAQRGVSTSKAVTMPVKAPARRRPPPGVRPWNFDTYPFTPSRPYSGDVTVEHVHSLAIDLSVLAVASVYIGMSQWGWGDKSFHVRRENWFGKSTDYGGADKFGHAWSAQLMSDYFTWRLRSIGYGNYESAVTGAILAGVAFFAIEVGDGFSHFGFSVEDFIASSAGIGVSFLRNTVPGLAEKVDFRMQFIPTGNGDRLGLGDYSGKKFLLAWKFSGFEQFRDGPLRHLEIHTGYYTRGYSDWEAAAGIPKTRTPYVGVGLNLAELLFSDQRVRDSLPGALARTALGYIQVPYTYYGSDGQFR